MKVDVARLDAMIKRFQFGRMLMALASIAVIGGLGTGSLFAQSHPDRPPQRQSTQAPAPKPATNAHVNPPNANRPSVNQTNRPSNHVNNGNENRPPSAPSGPTRTNNFNNRPNGNAPVARMSPRQQVGVGSPRPFVEKMRDLTPQHRH